MKLSFIIPLTIIAILGVILLLFATQTGMDLCHDSVLYITSARNLINGLGLVRYSSLGKLVPFTHCPPFYPFLLAVIGTLGIDPLISARFLNAFLFGGNIALAGFLVLQYTKNIKFALLSSVLMLTSIDMLAMHSAAMTESLFIFLSMSAFGLLAAYLNNNKRAFLISSAFLVALSMLTRFAGSICVATGLTVLLFLNPKSFRQRMVDAITFGALSALPSILWSIRNLLLAGNIANRQVYFHPVTWRHLNSTLSTISGWFISRELPYIVRSASVALILAGILAWIYFAVKTKKKGSKEAKSRLPQVLLVYILLYFPILMISISWFDGATPMDPRLLSPVFAAGMVAGLCLLHQHFFLAKSSALTKRLILAGLILLAISYIARGSAWIANNADDADGFLSHQWQRSLIIQKLKNLHEGIPIYTNQTTGVYFLAGKPAITIPEKINRYNKRANTNYLNELNAMMDQIQKENGVLAYFNQMSYQASFPSERELIQGRPLSLLMRAEDGNIYTPSAP